MRKRKSLREIYSYLKENEICIFNLDDFSRIFNLKKNYAALVIFRLKNEGYIKEFEKGKYVLEGSEDTLSIGCFSIRPSYISFKTALGYYKFLKNDDNEIYLATLKRKAPFRFRSHIIRYVFLKTHRFFGFTDEMVNKNYIKIALPEKAIIDSIMLPEYGPEIEDLIKILTDRKNELYIDRLVKYAIRMNDKSLVARLAFMLYLAGIDVDIDDKYLPKFYIKLVPDRERKGRWINRFKIIDNLEI
uniref:AbiEi antitoxin C-terminal domain-containing protein n=1 Tax=candidate division WOR-3 bacterium TaxID=2052148 RepID=A0A7C4U8E3_UNCW3